MNLAGRNHPCGTKELAGDNSDRRKSSLRKKRAGWRCIWLEEIISVEQKSWLGMHLTGGNHPYGTKKLAGDASGWLKSSLRHKKASWGCIRLVEIIPAAQKS